MEFVQNKFGTECAFGSDLWFGTSIRSNAAIYQISFDKN